MPRPEYVYYSTFETMTVPLGWRLDDDILFIDDSRPLPLH